MGAVARRGSCFLSVWVRGGWEVDGVRVWGDRFALTIGAMVERLWGAGVGAIGVELNEFCYGL